MAGVQNSGQYCYFSALMQCFTNNVNMRTKIIEHMEAVEDDASKCHALYVLFSERSFHQ